MYADVSKANLPERYTLKGKEKRGLGERRPNEPKNNDRHETHLDNLIEVNYELPFNSHSPATHENIRIDDRGEVLSMETPTMSKLYPEMDVSSSISAANIHSFQKIIK